jgi:hypothetical protein
MSILRYKQKLLPLGNPQGGSGGGSGGGGQATQQSQYSSISPWAQPYISSILGAAQQQVFNVDPTSGQITGVNPYTAYGMNGAGMSPAAQQAAQSSVAGFTPLQNQAFTGAANLQTPEQFGSATGAAATGTLQALGAGQGLQNQLTSPGAIASYMNPYIQNALNPALQTLNQQYGIAGQQAAGQATAAGAFGGTRNALQQNLNAQNQMLAQNQLVGNAYQNAYANAQQQAQNVAQLGLQGAQAGISGAGQLGQLGSAQLAAQQGILGLQNQYGTQQQQQQQNIINQAMQNYQTAQQYPMTQLTQLKSLAQGLPITDVTTTQQAAPPSTLAQLSGLGIAGLGAAGAAGAFNSAPTINVNTPQTNTTTAKAGGIMKAKNYAQGGLVELSLYNTLKEAV